MTSIIWRERISEQFLHFRERDIRNVCIWRCTASKDIYILTPGRWLESVFLPFYIHLQEFLWMKILEMYLLAVTCESWRTRIENVLEQFRLCWNVHSCVRWINLSRMKKNLCYDIFFYRRSIFHIKRTWTRTTLKILITSQSYFLPFSFEPRQ